MKALIKILFISVFSLIFYSQSFSYGKYGNIERNDAIIQMIQNGGQEYISKQKVSKDSDKPLSIIWVQKDYLTKQQALDLQNKIDTAIVQIRNILDIPKNERNFTIHYYVYGAREASHAITGYRMLDKAHPTTFITWYALGRSPYVHETTHIIAWHWRSVWIKEGLAVYLNQKLNGEPTFPNFGKNLNYLAKKHIHQLRYSKVGKNGLVFFRDIKQKRVFYLLSGSFTEYLFTNLDTKKFMQIYNSNDTRNAIYKYTGKTIDQWEFDWINYLKTNNFTEYQKEN